MVEIKPWCGLIDKERHQNGIYQSSGYQHPNEENIAFKIGIHYQNMKMGFVYLQKVW